MNSAWLAGDLLGAALCAFAAWLAKPQSSEQGASVAFTSDARSGRALLAGGLVIQALAFALPANTISASTARGALFILAAACLAAGFAWPANSTRARVLLALDSALVGAALAAILWWLRLEKIAPAHGAKLLLMAAVLALTASAAALFRCDFFGRTARDFKRDAAQTMGFLGALCIAGADFALWSGRGAFGFGNAGSGATSHGAAMMLAAIGAMLMGAGALAAQRFADSSESPAARRSAGTTEIVAVPVAACLMLLMSAWHGAHHNVGWRETWWAPVLAALAVARFLWTALRDTQNGSEFGRTLSDENTALRDQLQRRTHQLSTLHAITADLNNTLDSEKLLITALERMREAVGADGGAVWLLVGDAALGTHDTDGGAGVGSASALMREIERSAAERRAIDSLKIGRDGAAAPSADVPLAARRWRQVHDVIMRPEARETLQSLHNALERGDMAACEKACGENSSGEVPHIAAIRWKGDVIGAMGVTRLHGAWESAERALLDALALEVGVALQNAQLYQEASRLADRDGLTDLLNHRAIQQQLNAILSRARRMPTEFSIVLMDVKNFGFFNSTYGHPVGDKVLRIVAQCLRDACRTSDVLGRFGGDEFIAVLLDTDAPGTQHVCERIARLLQAESFQVAGDGRRIPIGISFGAALYPDDGTSALDLLTVANASLEESKSGGEPFALKQDKARQTRELRQLKEVGGSFGVLDALVTAIDNKDHYTRRHSEDVSHWATLMSQQLEHDEETQRAVRICGLLHDVGKIAVPDAILRKPGRLADDEFHIMQQHPVFGALIVKDVPNLAEVLGGVRHHHERFDGKGYPDKLKSEDIPLLGRMLAVPDCFSAMTTERPYRKALSWSEAIAEIEKGRGTQFDPQMADAFLEVIARLIIEKNAQQGGAEAADEGAIGDGDTVSDSSNGVLRPRSVADAVRAA